MVAAVCVAEFATLDIPVKPQNFVCTVLDIDTVVAQLEPEKSSSVSESSTGKRSLSRAFL